MRVDRYCTCFWLQVRGLMFRNRENLVMEFSTPRKVSLHMFFVFYPIDVLLLDSNKKIVEIKRNFKPFTFWKSSKRGKYVVELAFPDKYELGEIINLKK